MSAEHDRKRIAAGQDIGMGANHYLASRSCLKADLRRAKLQRRSETMKIMDIGKKMNIAPGTPWYIRAMLHGAKWALRIRAFCVILWRSLVAK